MSALDKPLRGAILAAASNRIVQRTVSRYGFALGAGRFIAGETADDFLAVAKTLNAEGFAVACGILGEGVRDAREASDAADQYGALLRTFAQRGLDANVAFKPTHVGLEIDPDLAFENASRIAAVAEQTGNTIRLDMEQSALVDPTLSLYERLRNRYGGVGCVLQSYLYRSQADLNRLLPFNPNVRLVKGAYLESSAVAYPRKADVDAAYLRLVETALRAGGYTAVATHDPRMIDGAIAHAERLRLPKTGRFEFQMLYGIGGPLARSLRDRGYRVRLAVPFGANWFPYLMRRLAERPANLAFFFKGALRRG